MRTLEPAVALRFADMAEELAGVGYWWMDTASQTIRWSPNMYKIYGLAPGLVPSLDYAMQFVHPDDRAGADANLERNLLGGSARSTARIVRPSGEIRHIEGRNACEHGPDGKVLAIFGTVHDVTERIADQKAIEDSERRYRLLAENATDVTFCFQPDGTITFVTPSVTRLLGHEADDLIGRSIYGVMHADDHDRVKREFLDYLKQGADAEPIKIEFRAHTRQGRELWLESHPRTLFDGSGGLIEVQDVIRDISARKQMETDILAAKAAAESALAVKAEFLANISHELRTPLTAIIGYSTLLAETSDLGDDARRHTENVVSASRILLSLVNGILDLSRLEAGQLIVSASICSPAELARECLGLLALPAAAKGVKLDYFQAEGVPLAVSIDPDAYRQILVNLIGNAVKFTDAGQVRLSVEFNAVKNELGVSVEDTGEGIASEDIKKLFSRFSQIDGTSTRRHGGAGLGLAISKGLVEAMGGEIAVRSEPGVGSIFSFRIPARIPALAAEIAPAGSAPGELPPAGARILVVDDNSGVRELVRAILESCGSEVTDAVDGAAAVEIAMTEPFDLILLDLRMPRLSGREVAAVLRSRRGPNLGIPIIAFTASSEIFDSEGCRQWGFDAVLAKPVAARDLLSIVAQYANASAQGWAT